MSRPFFAREQVEKAVHSALKQARCPVHGGAPKDIRLAWDSNEMTVLTEPCCDAIDRVVMDLMSRELARFTLS